MVDIYLQQMLKINSLPKTKFDIAYEKFLDEYVDSLEIQREPGALSSIEAKKIAIKEDIKKAADTFALDHYVFAAITFLENEGVQYIEPPRFQEMLAGFQNMRQKLEIMDLDNVLDDAMDFFEINETVLQDIAEIGLKKFLEKDYSLSLSCFVLLSFLRSKSAEYWYKLGIAAQKCEKYTLALHAFSQAIQINPEFIGAKLFSCQCYLETGQMALAEELLNQVKALGDKESGWDEVIGRIDSQISGF